MTAPVVFFELLRAQRLGAHACERRNSALAGGTGCRRELDSLPQAATIQAQSVCGHGVEGPGWRSLNLLIGRR
jgi:hypothetical protein